MRDLNRVSEEEDYTRMANNKTNRTAVSITKRTAVYKVAPGDSLWSIAEKYLGSGSRYGEIKELNGLMYDAISVGQKLKIPNK